MDRNTVIGFVLIALVLMVWMWMNVPPPQPKKKLPEPHDTTTVMGQKNDTATQPPVREQRTADDTLGKFFASRAKGAEKLLTIETENYVAVVSTKGGVLKSWELKKYKTWDHQPVNLIEDQTQGELGLIFYSSEGKLINTKSLYYTADYSPHQKIELQGTDSVSVQMIMPVNDSSRLIKTFTFRSGRYDFELEYRFEKMGNILSNFEYQLTWDKGVRYAEHNSIDESRFAKAQIFAGGEVTELDAASFDSPVREDISGRVTWVGTTNKYFGVAIIPQGLESKGASIDGKRMHMPDEGAREEYSLALRLPYLGNNLESSRFTVFMGPLDFDIVKSYGVHLDLMMSLGAAWVIRPIAEYVMIPLFQFLKIIIPNYGVVLIIFSFIIKLALHPLTKQQMASMRKMQQLQPMLEEVKEKYKDDPQKMNMQIMRLYKEYGVNPAGGCLPLLLQMPILYALWTVFNSAIELRHAAFVWWIHDLSVPDVIAELPFKLPLFGINKISGLALLMGITMFIQQKMTVKDPRQKMMVWMMPLMMTLLFNGFPAGLNLYYFVFNLLSIGQQWWMTKHQKDEPLKKVEGKKKRGGIFKHLTKNLPDLKR
jgi:YidC/Oxa1 family membrane protein insertase